MKNDEILGFMKRNVYKNTSAVRGRVFVQYGQRGFFEWGRPTFVAKYFQTFQKLWRVWGCTDKGFEAQCWNLAEKGDNFSWFCAHVFYERFLTVLREPRNGCVETLKLKYIIKSFTNAY